MRFRLVLLPKKILEYMKFVLLTFLTVSIALQEIKFMFHKLFVIRLMGSFFIN